MKTTNYDKEDRNKHLEFIQNAINRMASNSFILKGWSVTLITGIIALSLTTSTTKFIYLAYIPTLAFWGLDAYYLRQEKLFRELYDYVRAKEIKNIEPFSLNTLLQSPLFFRLFLQVNRIGCGLHNLLLLQGFLPIAHR